MEGLAGFCPERYPVLACYKQETAQIMDQ